MSLNRYSQFAQKMIGLNRQIFRLNNVRTFFLSVSNTFPKRKREKIKCLDEFEGTTTKGRDYKMALVKDNVRVMTVNDKTLNDAVGYWSIRVGVGYDDDPPHYLGLAHLLEHVIARTYLNKYNCLMYYCETKNFETRFSFAVPFDHHAKASRAWTKIIFSNSRIKNDIMKKERNRLDNEYQESRCGLPFTAHRTSEILKQKQDITLAQFGCGNLKTLSQFKDDDVMGALKVFRTLYRRRPLNVCVYSAKKIEMADVIRSLDIDGSITKVQQEEAREPNWEERLKSVEAQHLVLQQSANDSIQLNIIYPFRKKLSLTEEDTFKIVSDLMSYSLEGQLGHGLFEKKMARSCVGYSNMNINSFVVTIMLTAVGLERIQQVTRMVHDYFQFLRDNWQDIDLQPLIAFNRNIIDEKSNQDFAYCIARCLGRVTNPFDEEDLFVPLLLGEGQQLISEQILNNKCIRHTIAARNVDDVCNTLAVNAGLVAKGAIETEVTVGTQFRYLETGLFAEPSNSCTNFTLPQFDITELEKEEEEELKKEQLEQEKEEGLAEGLAEGLEEGLEEELEEEEKEKEKDLPVFIIKPEDEAFLALCSHYLELKTAHLIEPHNLEKEGKYGIFRNPDGSISLLFDRENTEKYLEKYHPETQIDFDYYKQSLMEEYSMLMTNSRELAKSLLETALGNLTSNIKRDSVPLQYNVLKDMDFSKYKEHFAELNSENEIQHENVGVSKAFKKTFAIKSINVDESSTVTLAFLTQPGITDHNNLQDLATCLTELLEEGLPNLYSCACTVDEFGAAKGLFLTVGSVEGKNDQTGAAIRELLGDQINRNKVLKIIEKHHPKSEQKTLKKLWNEMRKHQIIIQIVGHEKGCHPSGSFQTHFEEWFKEHEQVFNHINDIG